MTMLERVREILSQVELRHYPLYYRFEDRGTGEPVHIHVHTGPTLDENASDTDILWAARNLLVFVAVHEVGEGFHFAGHRVFDPHLKECPTRVAVPDPTTESWGGAHGTTPTSSDR
jgi:hypothetical protein